MGAHTIDVQRLEGDVLGLRPNHPVASASPTLVQVYRVSVREGGGGDATEHRVTMKAADFERLRAADEASDAFLRRCFEFLLERESRESILSSFDLMVIARYFPEFERTIRRA
jgi:hypothetical protein